MANINWLQTVYSNSRLGVRRLLQAFNIIRLRPSLSGPAISVKPILRYALDSAVHAHRPATYKADDTS